MRYFIDTNTCKKDADGNLILNEDGLPMHGPGTKVYEWKDRQAEFFLKNQAVKASFVEVEKVEKKEEIKQVSSDDTEQQEVKKRKTITKKSDK